MRFPSIDNLTRLKLLQPSEDKISMVLDTDTYNEIDDQFALVYSLLSPERLNVEAVYAAPFWADDSINDRSESPEDGMEKSYDEILRLLEKLGCRSDGFVFKGSRHYLPAADKPVKSEAVTDLIERAMTARKDPLYVVSIAAITNIASAILLEPRIIERIVIVWLGGHPYYWPTAREFNLMQDLPASQLIFNCGVPLIHVPCKNVAEHLRTTVPELNKHIRGLSPIGDYLFDSFAAYKNDNFAWSKEIWDIANIAYLVNPDWTPSTLIHSPILTDQMTLSFDPSRHFIREVTDINRDAVFKDLFNKLKSFASGKIQIKIQ